MIPAALFIAGGLIGFAAAYFAHRPLNPLQLTILVGFGILILGWSMFRRKA